MSRRSPAALRPRLSASLLWQYAEWLGGQNTREKYADVEFLDSPHIAKFKLHMVL
jgi:hypothetical protein